ncbi:helix-turn-helix domain-containing protein [Mycobacterium ahvazicum]|nr:helix-turn-helix transcriptional regulator [Mycobacterium ahvazicum]
MPRESRSFAEVVGQNCERLRAQIGITQDELARYARDLGLRWKASAVGDFEAGRSAPKFATVVTVAIALQWALEDLPESRGEAGRPAGINLADLVVSDGWVMLTDTFKVSGRFLADACRGHVATLETLGVPISMRSQVKTQGVVIDAVADLSRRAGLTERRQAKRLGVEPGVLAALSLRLWQKTFSDERDRRAGPDANRQKRAQVTRAMQAELDELLPRFTRRGGELAKLAEAEIWAHGDD